MGGRKVFVRSCANLALRAREPFRALPACLAAALAPSQLEIAAHHWPADKLRAPVASSWRETLERRGGCQPESQSSKNSRLARQTPVISNPKRRAGD